MTNKLEKFIAFKRIDYDITLQFCFRNYAWNKSHDRPKNIWIIDLSQCI